MGISVTVANADIWTGHLKYEMSFVIPSGGTAPANQKLACFVL